MVWRSLRSMLLGCGLLLLTQVERAPATLTIYQGKVASMVSYDQVEGVAVLNIGSDTRHFFDCVGTSASVDALRWEKGEGTLRFPVTTETVLFDDGMERMVKRMNLAPNGAEHAGYSDEGIYVCINGNSNEMVSINITGGSTGLCAVEANEDVILDGTAELRVYVAADPPLASQEIIWSRANSGTDIVSGSRIQLTDSNRRLLVHSAGLGDSGSYQVRIRRQISLISFVVLARISIDLNVHVGVVVVSSPVSTPALEHASVTFTCVFRGNPPPTITWEREGSEDLPVVTRREITAIPVRNESVTLYTVTTNFTISNVLYEDQGRYRCVAANTLTGEVQRAASSALAELTVTPRLRLTAEDPHTVDENGLVSVSEGDPVAIQCSGSGDLAWGLSSGAAIPETNMLNPPMNVYQRYDQTNNIQSLFIQSFSLADVALYTCTTDLVDNGNSFSASAYITSSDPVIYIAEEIVYAPAGSSAVIRATVYSSGLNSLVIEWYYEGSLITTSDHGYSFSAEGMSLHTLSIASVGVNTLGTYQAVVTVGDRNHSDTVRLALTVPPNATVVPASYEVSEDEMATFRCLAGGTQPTVTWSLLGNQPLPSGVVSSGNDLTISRASQNHAGQYECTVTNSAGMATSTATLTVHHAPMATIVREGTTETSLNQVLQVIAEEGEPAPTFSCSSDGSPPPTLTWEGQDGGVALPNGVSLIPSRPSPTLVWTRVLEYTDSGSYVCTASNGVGAASSARLQLLVRRPLAITTVYPTAPVTSSSSSSNLIVPLGYRGTVVTCVATGWPTPTIEYVGNFTRNRVSSETVRNDDLAFVSARLRWLDGFLESDAGDYTCIVRANDTNSVLSQVVSLELRVGTPSPTPPPVTCSVESRQAYFQVRVLDTNCLTWGEDLKTRIASSLMSKLVGTVVAECPGCVLTSQNIEVAGPPTCSDQVERAAIFRGMITAEDAGKTQDIFCSLNKWQQSGPLVCIEGNFHLVDRTCTIELQSLTDVECASGGTKADFPMLFVAIGASVGGVLIILTLFILVSCCCYCCCKPSKKSDRRSQTSPYERTRHVDSVTLTCYTDGTINPDTPTFIAGNTDSNIYSTLNRDEMEPPRPSLSQDQFGLPLPPPPQFTRPPQEIEMDNLRKNSRSLLLGDTVDGKSGNTPFQMVQDGKAEPYQVAVRSRDNLSAVGHGQEGTSADPRVMNGGRYETKQPMRLAHTLSHGAIPATEDNTHIGPASTEPNPRFPYEQIDRKYGVNEFSRSSPKLQEEARAFPTRVASSGHVIPQGVPTAAAGFRRHTSAVEARNTDYTRLNRGERPPPIVTTNHRLGRLTSSSSMTASTPTGHQTHHSITNYNRGSPRLSEQLDITKTPLPTSPNNDLPPTYEEASAAVSLSYSRSGDSSLMENGAYEGVGRPPVTTHGGVIMTREGVRSDEHLAASPRDLRDQQQWYHNASDFSIDHECQDTTATSSISPYSRVDFDSRRSLESARPIDTRVHTFSLPNGAPHQNANIFHTVVV